MVAEPKFDLAFKRWVGVLSGLFYGANSFNYGPIIKSAKKKLAALFKKVVCILF